MYSIWLVLVVKKSKGVLLNCKKFVILISGNNDLMSYERMQQCKTCDEAVNFCICKKFCTAPCQGHVGQIDILHWKTALFE